MVRYIRSEGWWCEHGIVGGASMECLVVPVWNSWWCDIYGVKVGGASVSWLVVRAWNDWLCEYGMVGGAIYTE